MECRRQKLSSRIMSLGGVGAGDSVAIHRTVAEWSKEDMPSVFQQARISLKWELAIAHIKRNRLLSRGLLVPPWILFKC